MSTNSPIQSIPTVELEAGAVGSIVQNPEKRAQIYAVGTYITLALQSISAGLLAGVGAAGAATQFGIDVPLAVPFVALAAVSGAWLPVQGQISALARANTSKPLPPAEVVAVEPEA